MLVNLPRQHARCLPRPAANTTVMPELVPGIHVFVTIKKKDVDGRVIGERKRPSDGYARP
jgi:hypothetical protein